MRGLYAIVDVDLCRSRGLLPVALAEALFDAKPAALQLRDKHGAARDTLTLLRAMVPLAARAGVPFFANDRVDLALLAGCDGVHVGQDDVPVRAARDLAADHLMLGVSTHNRADVEGAFGAPADYVAIGPVFATTSKERPSPTLGLSGLLELASLARLGAPNRPLVAIGGVTIETAGATGALVDAVAMIGALVPPEPGVSVPERLSRVRARAERLHRAVLGEAL